MIVFVILLKIDLEFSEVKIIIKSYIKNKSYKNICKIYIYIFKMVFYLRVNYNNSHLTFIFWNK